MTCTGDDILRPAGVGAPGRRFVFVLMARFTMISFAAAIEPLRIANRVLARGQYRWLLAGPGNETARCSNGAEVSLDCGLEEEFGRGDVVIICGGPDAGAAGNHTLLDWLRRVVRQGAEVGAVCSGALVLARAGLLEGRRAAISAEHHAAFQAVFPGVILTDNLFERDGPCLTAAGGTAAMDMMLALIAADHGAEVAGRVAEHLRPSVLRPAPDQRAAVPARLGPVVAIMEAHIAEPISPATLAERMGMSIRQLERLFQHHTGRSPKRYYMELRLQTARKLLLQKDASVTEVALACGFASHAHFSKCYRAFYDTTPLRERGVAAQRMGAMR